MTGEEMERAIEFILQSQAALDARMGRVEEQIERVSRDLGERIAQTQRQLDETNRVVQMQSVTQTKFNTPATDTLNGIADAQNRHIEMLRLTTETQMRINQALVESDRQLGRALAEAQQDERRIIATLTESQRRTDDRVDRLAETVERFIREGWNGRE